MWKYSSSCRLRIAEQTVVVSQKWPVFGIVRALEIFRHRSRPGTLCTHESGQRHSTFFSQVLPKKVHREMRHPALQKKENVANHMNNRARVA